MPAAEVVVEDLSHCYRGSDVWSLDRVNFRAAPGDRLGLLGPNGAGKSTLMRILCGYLPVHQAPPRRVPNPWRRTFGHVAVGGFDARTHSLQLRGCVGYLPEHVPLYLELCVREHLAFRAAIKHVPRKRRRAEVERVAEAVGLAGKLDVTIGKLSRGYRQRVGLADALLGEPGLLVLDEPTVGLDPNQVIEIRELLRGLGGSHTLLFSSHVLAEVEALCDKIVILSHGRVVGDEKVESHSNTLLVRWVGELEHARRVLEIVRARLAAGLAPDSATTGRASEADAVGLAVAFTITDDVVTARVDATTMDVELLMRSLGEASSTCGLPIIALERAPHTLERRFAALTAADAERNEVRR